VLAHGERNGLGSMMPGEKGFTGAVNDVCGAIQALISS